MSDVEHFPHMDHAQWGRHLLLQLAAGARSEASRSCDIQVTLQGGRREPERCHPSSLARHAKNTFDCRTRKPQLRLKDPSAQNKRLAYAACCTSGILEGVSAGSSRRHLRQAANTLHHILRLPFEVYTSRTSTGFLSTLRSCPCTPCSRL